MKKIADWPGLILKHLCKHPEHLPPNHTVLDPGVYVHECPGCGATAQVYISPSARGLRGDSWIVWTGATK